MVVTTLGIVFDDENDGIRGEGASRDGFNHLAEREVVIGDLRLWRGVAPGMIVWQIKKVKSGPDAVDWPGAPDKTIRPYHQDLQVPPRHIHEL